MDILDHKCHILMNYTWFISVNCSINSAFQIVPCFQIVSQTCPLQRNSNVLKFYPNKLWLISFSFLARSILYLGFRVSGPVKILYLNCCSVFKTFLYKTTLLSLNFVSNVFHIRIRYLFLTPQVFPPKAETP